MAAKDFYELLGVEPGASSDDLKKAYRRLAKELHPDRNPDKDAEQKFKEVNEAYDILSDEEKRAAYDRFGHAGINNGGQGGPFAGFAAGSGTSFADVFDDLFGEFRGRQRAGNARTRGADMRFNLEITLEDAFHGRAIQIRVPTAASCEKCSGTGAEGDSRPSACPTCNGVGRVRAQQGFFTIERTCPGCNGAGQVIKSPCRACGGTGRVRKEKNLSVQIRSGVEDGTRIRLAGEGETGIRGGPPGDLYIFLTVSAHRLFQRDGKNLHVRAPIPMTTAALGGSIEVPGLDGGRAKVAVTAGTQSGKQFRLKGKGMPSMRQNDGAGDLMVHAMIETPMNLNKKQEELLRQFAEAGEARTTSPESQGFLDKLKEFWDDLKG
ncbi:MAG: molecular chaperone DnaJ [Alphaproteobacteria bacterium]|nr:molecular chaperone DnaJ [Alphaproteobacteria bacterium]